MEYFKASEDHAEQIYNLVQNTITVVYPRYYPEAVVDFFCSLHNRTNISRDIEDGCVRVLWNDGRMVGTGSCKGSHITRVFVAPEFQGQGYGRRIMENLEREMIDLTGKMDYDSINKKWAKSPGIKLLWQKYVWGNRQKVALWN